MISPGSLAMIYLNITAPMALEEYDSDLKRVVIEKKRLALEASEDKGLVVEEE